MHLNPRLINYTQDCLSHMRNNEISFDGPLICDGKLHRFSMDTKRNQPDEWYICFSGVSEKGNDYLTCVYGSWSGGQERHIYNSYESEKVLSYDELSDIRAKEAERKVLIEQQLQVAKKERVQRAQETWEQSTNNPTLPGHSAYLQRKQVNAYDIRYRVERDGSSVLVIPLRNIEGELQAIQCIYEDGRKRIYGAKKGNFHLIGSLEGKSLAYIVEGYATGSSIHQAKEIPVAIAFDCGNLKFVAVSLKQRYPQIRFIIAGDDDVETVDNPGRSKAQEAGKVAGCEVILPKFQDDFKLPGGKSPTDFNDLHVHFGLSEVISQLQSYVVLTEVSKTEATGKFKFLSADSLTQYPPKANWLIKPYLDAGSLAVLFGEPASMKSFLAIDMGCCVAAGKDWHGMAVRKSGAVFYIAGEGFNGLCKRLRAWSIANDQLLENTPFFVSNRPAQFLDVLSAAEVIAAIDELIIKHGKPEFVIIDTLNRNFGPGDENQTQDMSKFVACIDTLIRLKYECTVLIVHHSPLNDNKRTRGSSALHGAVDWEYCLTKQGEDRKLSSTKVKDYEPPTDMIFKPRSISLDGWVDEEDGETMTSCVLKKVDGSAIQKNDLKSILKGPQKVVYDSLIKLCKADGSDDFQGIHIEDWRNAAYEAGVSSSSEQATKRKAFKRALDYLKQNDFVLGDNNFWKLRDTGQG